ncbi:MAG TPA: maleylpyruvate isomerase family mycothiol-dependent enzyme [Actinomycetes bacterium]|nr:maleylpyruvate isomerase family mycothiol-dependent enzyme [Actinomycetes bacterium]
METTHGRVGRLLAGLAPAAWEANVPATPAWSVADVVAHLAEGDRAALAAALGSWAMAGSIDQWAAAGVAAHAGEPPEARLEGWEAAADAFRWHLAALDGEGWRGRVPWVSGSISVRTLGVLRLNDAWHHGRDVAEAAGERFEIDEPTLAFLADLAARTIPGGLSRRGRARPGAVILLRLGANQWLLGGAAGERPDPGAAPDLVLEADPLAFVLRAAGRATDDPWRVEGDAALAADVSATLSSVA